MSRMRRFLGIFVGKILHSPFFETARRELSCIVNDVLKTEINDEKLYLCSLRNMANIVNN